MQPVIAEAPEEKPEEEEENEDDIAVAAAAPLEEEEEEEEEEEYDEEEEVVPAPEPQREWVFPPATMIPLKYQKNKFYYQYRIDELPEDKGTPEILIGYSRADFDPEIDFLHQENVWCMSLQTGDKFTKKKWKAYYEIDLENQVEPPKHGLFETGSVIGVMLDTDRGAMCFYKDGNDLGLAFLTEELREGEFMPFVRTQCQCKLSHFTPRQFPWYADVPVEPAPPAEPTRDSEYLYSEIEEDEQRAAGGGKENDIGIEDEETLEAMFRGSLEYIDSDEERRLEDVVDEEYAKLFDMRDSNRFELDRTRAHLKPLRVSVANRESIKVKHRDLGLDTHTKQVREAGMRNYDSQIYSLKDMADYYEGSFHLS